MELNTAFKNKANKLEKKWANTPHKYEGIQQADGYEKGAADMLNAVEAIYETDLNIWEEKRAVAIRNDDLSGEKRANAIILYITQKLSDLQSIKPL
jgi:hypothetical protein